jgi:hypothetical protein
MYVTTTFFWNGIPCSMTDTSISEKHIASMFRVLERCKQQVPPKQWYPHTRLQNTTVLNYSRFDLGKDNKY